MLIMEECLVSLTKHIYVELYSLSFTTEAAKSFYSQLGKLRPERERWKFSTIHRLKGGRVSPPP